MHLSLKRLSLTDHLIMQIRTKEPDSKRAGRVWALLYMQLMRSKECYKDDSLRRRGEKGELLVDEMPCASGRLVRSGKVQSLRGTFDTVPVYRHEKKDVPHDVDSHSKALYLLVWIGEDLQ